MFLLNCQNKILQFERVFVDALCICIPAIICYINMA